MAQAAWKDSGSVSGAASQMKSLRTSNKPHVEAQQMPIKYDTPKLLIGEEENTESTTLVRNIYIRQTKLRDDIQNY